MKVIELVSKLYEFDLYAEVLADEKPIESVSFGRMNEGGTLRPAVNIRTVRRFEEKK